MIPVGTPQSPQLEKTLYVGHIPLKITDWGCMKSRRNVASAPFGVWALDPTSQTSGMLHAQQLLFRMPSLFLCLGAPQSRRCWSSTAFHEIYSYMVLHSISSLSSTFVAKKQCKAHWNPFQRCSRYSTRHWPSLIGTWKSWPFSVQQLLAIFSSSFHQKTIHQLSNSNEAFNWKSAFMELHTIWTIALLWHFVF